MPRLNRFAPVAACLLCCAAAAAETVFPGAEWEQRPPESLGMDAAALRRLAELLGGRGCVVKDGFVAASWGDQAERGDWYSSAKPVLSTMLFFALKEGRVKSVDQPVADFGWPLREKDRGMTFRHLGAMSGGYARPEAPGEAWAYNDFAIQLYQMTLFDRVFGGGAKETAEAPRRLGLLGLQDGLKFNGKRRLYASVRDFARIVWFWANKGNWHGAQALPRGYFDQYMTPQTPGNLPRTARDVEEDDYLGIGSYGGASDQGYHGPGIYGFNWWFNATGRLNPHNLTWPDAPPDTVMSLGHGGNCAAFMPSLGLAVVCAQGNWGKEEAGDPANQMNQVLKLAAEAAGYRSPAVRVTGAMRQWQPVTLSFRGPELSEGGVPNPFTDYRLDVVLRNDRGESRVPGYYAADGNAANTGADSGPVWRAHFLPPHAGEWRYEASFLAGENIACAGDVSGGAPAAFHGVSGSFHVDGTDPDAPGALSKGLLQYTGKRYLQFAATGGHFLKGGADSPENFLACADMDQTPPTHRYEPHAGDWRPGDPTWGDGRGKNIIGALNYLASKGMNSVYFLTMNVGGDGKDVWPWTGPDERFRFDCGKLDQWETVFSHMDRLGVMLHVVTQEQENDQLLDCGELGPERRMYYRELAARFAHHPMLVWNLGEENTNTDAQRKAFAGYIRALDHCRHPIVVHTFPGEYDKVYAPLLGFSAFEGASLQLGDMTATHDETLKWVRRSAEAGRPWVVCQDEIGPPDTGVKPDADDPGHDEVRRHALWGNLMAGGAGSEWLFGYKHAHNDINCEDWRSRDGMWDQTRHALEFFQKHLLFWEMEPDGEVVAGGEGWCLAKGCELLAVYTPNPAECLLKLPLARYAVQWYNPRAGGELVPGRDLHAGGTTPLGPPPDGLPGDWAVILKGK